MDELFWADEIAKDIVSRRDHFTVATGITPSGHIHVGNLREVGTADIIVRALRALGKEVRFVYIADTFDPLRHVYPFLDEKVYAKHVGAPLSRIPAPDGSDQSYADYFLKPFLHALENLDIKVELIRANEAYEKGLYTANIIKALEATNKIRDILKEETGKKTQDDWSPFQVICNACKRMSDTTVRGFHAQKKVVQYSCQCGDEGEVSMQGGGKLTWRVDWPARWQMYNISVEPFGKDHASSGGSYDTGQRISKEVFGYDAPYGVIYEWIGLKGAGDMSSSKGNVISVAEVVSLMPPEVLKYFIFKHKPQKRLMFDPGLPLLSLLDEYDDPSSKERSQKAHEYANISNLKGTGVPFRHVLTLHQIYQGNIDQIMQALKRTGFDHVDQVSMKNRLMYAKQWLKDYGPQDMKFEIQEKTPEQISQLSVNQRQALKHLAMRSSQSFLANDYHQLIYAIKDELGLSPNEIFEAIYIALLAKTKGPRAGMFLSSLKHDFIKQRFLEASGN